MEQNLKIKFNAKNAAFDEVADSIGDLIRAGLILEDVLEDGFKLTEIFQLIPLQPIVNEIVEDVPVFLEQFVQLTPETAALAINEVEVRFSGKLGPVTSKILEALKLLAGTYGFAQKTYLDAEAQIAAYKNLFTKPEILEARGKAMAKAKQ